MRSIFITRRTRPALRAALATCVLFGAAAAAELPDGPGKAETEKLCSQCHDIAKSVSLRQDRNGWGATITKMIGMGMEGSDEEYRASLEYLAKHFPAEELPPLNVNKARAIELESRLSLKRSEAAAVIRHRREHGDFQSIEDLKKVPGIDVAKIEAKRDIVTF